MQTSKQDHFAHVPSANIQRSVFDRRHTVKLPFNCSELVPYYWDAYVPGDTFDIDIAFVARTTTPIFPVMDNLWIEFFLFNIPYRLLFDGWEALHGENKDTAWVPHVPPAKVPSFICPGPLPYHSIGDYMGLVPQKVSSSWSGVLSVLPFRAYGLVYNEWFRDQNLQNPIYINTSAQDDTINAAYHPYKPCFRVNKKHDYFTSCLPAPQKGVSVFLPLGDTAPVRTADSDTIGSGEKNPLWWLNVSGTSAPTAGTLGLAQGNTVLNNSVPSGTLQTVVPSNLYADLSDATSATISQLRQAFQLQRLFERDARGGTRYTEIIRAHFGVISPDARLQRPEYLGGFKELIGTHQVLQTSSTDSVSPQGNTAAYSLTHGRHFGIRQSFTEHGIVLGLLAVRNIKTYSQGINREFFKRDRFDFYYPALAHISEQPVYRREIYAEDGSDQSIFGYQEAWAEMRYHPNRVCGVFRPGAPGSLASWHYADYYESAPYLHASWITDNTLENVDRTLAVSYNEAPQIIADVLIKNRATRPLPVYSVPGLIDHF